MNNAWDDSLLRRSEPTTVKQKFTYPKILASKTVTKSYSIKRLKRNLETSCNDDSRPTTSVLESFDPFSKKRKVATEENFGSSNLAVSRSQNTEFSCCIPEQKEPSSGRGNTESSKNSSESCTNSKDLVLNQIENKLISSSPIKKHTKLAPRIEASGLLKRNLSGVINSVEFSPSKDPQWSDMAPPGSSSSNLENDEKTAIGTSEVSGQPNERLDHKSENLSEFSQGINKQTEFKSSCANSPEQDNQVRIIEKTALTDSRKVSMLQKSNSQNSTMSQKCSASQQLSSSSKATAQSSNMKCDNFVKLNMKQKTFVKGNSKFALNRKKFKHKQFQRFKSRKENSYMANMSKNGNRSSWKTSSEAPKSFEAVSLPDVMSYVKEAVLNIVPKFVNDATQSCIRSEKFTLDDDEFLEMLPGALKIFKIQNLQKWQLDCIKQIVRGKSSLVVKPTGSGKSLCYQLPALMLFKKFKTLTLVVSPLISLMDDQVKNCPRGLKAACYHSSLTESKRNNVLKELAENKIAVLFVSPETIVEGFVLRQMENFPSISFACIDEVHCISQWSHNFRPSYFRLCSTLKEHWEIQCFLGITATASKQTEIDMGRLLEITESQMFYDVRIPKNLRISASSDTHRLQSLVDLLEKEPFKSFSTVLIYCTKRNDCDAVAAHIRTVFGMQDLAESYHAGKSSSERAQIQKKFMNESLKIVSATVAFGMGLNKWNIRAVIHYNISGSVESFVQEIGRAGRNSNEVAFCHTFLNKDSMADLYEQERHVYSSFVEPSTIRKVAANVFHDLEFINCEHVGIPDEDHYHYAAVDLSMAASLDVKEETLLTMISYLETHKSKPLVIEKIANDFCSAFFYNGFNLPKSFLDDFPVFKVALKLTESGRGATRDGNKLSFKVSTVANFLNAPYEKIARSIFVSQTKNMGVKISLTAKSAVLKLRCCELNQSEILTEFLLDQTKYHENSKIRSLHFLFNELLMPVAEKSVFSCFPEDDELLIDPKVNSDIAEKVLSYFETVETSTNAYVAEKVALVEKDEYVARQKVRTFISLYHDMELSGLAICRILQGMDSPMFPAHTWCTVGKFWKSFVNCSFKSLLKICNNEVLKS